MATATISRPDLFPDGTTVNAYPASSQTPPGQTPSSGTPKGSSAGSGTVASGTLTITGLSDSTTYVLYASSPDRYLRHTTPPAATGGGGGVSAAPRIVGTLGTNLGSAQTITFTTAEEVWLLGTLNANLTITLAGRQSGARCKLIGRQDATGGRTVAFSDGTTSQAVSVTTTANAGVEAQADCTDATSIVVFNPGGSGPQGPQGIQGIQGPTGNTGSAGPIGQVQDEGSNLTVRSKINFVGAGVTAADNAGTGTTDVTIPGGGSGGGGGIFSVKPKTGRFYEAILTPQATTSTADPILGRVYATPFMVSQAMTIDQAVVEVATVYTSGTFRIGIYADDGTGYPGALIADWGSVDLSGAAGARPLTLGTPQVLTPGTVYWIGSGITADATPGTMRTYTNTGVFTPLGHGTGTETNAWVGVQSTGITGAGALLSNFPAGANYVSGPPRIQLRAA